MTTTKGSPRVGRPKIRFPKDEGVHPKFLGEWWYGNFSLTDSEGGEYGAMAAYFNMGLRILLVSDLAAEIAYPSVSGSTLHSAEGSLDLRWGGRDHWFRTDRKSLSYHLESYSTEAGISLDVVSEKPPLLGCENGLIEWTGGRSYLYSLTRLKVKGQIELSGSTIDVEGIGLVDHQWMDYAGQGGWDWFAVQLDNETEVVFWHIVNPDESLKSLDLNIIFPDGSVYYTKSFALERLDSWRSPDSGKEYGVRWRVREATHDLDLEIRARYAHQEIRLFESLWGPVFPFWEGRMTVAGHLDGEAVSGIGCAEVVRSPPELD